MCSLDTPGAGLVGVLTSADNRWHMDARKITCSMSTQQHPMKQAGTHQMDESPNPPREKSQLPTISEGRSTTYATLRALMPLLRWDPSSMGGAIKLHAHQWHARLRARRRYVQPLRTMAEVSYQSPLDATCVVSLGMTILSECRICVAALCESTSQSSMRSHISHKC